MAERAKGQTTRKVRTTMRPDEDLEVTETQEKELRASGLLVEKNEKAGA